MPFVLDAVEELRSTDIKIGSTIGYNDKMMGIVALAARGQGCEPDFMITPDSTNGKGRPYSYMMFRNMEALGVQNVAEVAKVHRKASCENLIEVTKALPEKILA